MGNGPLEDSKKILKYELSCLIILMAYMLDLAIMCVFLHKNVSFLNCFKRFFSKITSVKFENIFTRCQSFRHFFAVHLAF